MTTSPTPRLRRRQRIASDEAHAWARHLRFGNAYAKSVLLALTHYVNDEGACTAGLATLAEDTDLSVDTVRKRIRFLEDCGAIARFPRWIDERGRVNHDGRGKQTTDEIRLMLDADPDAIEARARGDLGEPEAGLQTGMSAAAPPISPSQQQGLNPNADSVRGGLGVGQGLRCSNPPDSFEPEPEDSPPNPPPGGSGLTQADEKESDHQPPEPPEHFAEFWAAYPGASVMDRARAMDFFRALKPDERAKARAATPYYAEALVKLKRRPKDAYKWLRDRGFDEFANARLPDRPKPMVWISEDSAAALVVAHAIAGCSPPAIIRDRDRGRGLWRRSAIEPDLATLASFRDDDPDDWIVITDGTAEVSAWRSRLMAWIGAPPDLRRVWSEPHDPAVHDLPPTHPRFRLRQSVMALRVPCRWPPRKDGTFCNDISITFTSEAAEE